MSGSQEGSDGREATIPTWLPAAQLQHKLEPGNSSNVSYLEEVLPQGWIKNKKVPLLIPQAHLAGADTPVWPESATSLLCWWELSHKEDAARPLESHIAQSMAQTVLFTKMQRRKRRRGEQTR